MPLTYDEALAIATAYLAANPFPLPAYRYLPPVGRSIPDGWYFDAKIERIDGEPMQYKRDAIGRAPGYKVMAASGEVLQVGWDEYHRLFAAG